ncbi:MAG TPA: zinc ribbon domain-containing protein, partial [Dermatophilaceae bacterium]|nr:zinc ribbon domain-containing protein [Dermatophilaceae bacterium]
GLSLKESERLLRLQRRLARARRGSNRRRKVRTLIGRLKATGGDRRKDWVEKTIASQSRKSQATFVCVSCGHRANADVNAARNIAAGHAVTARGDLRVLARSVKREPQHARPPKVA